jgi:16S rRNA (cytidine1402-2'-O)-methyltransferase
METAVAAPTGAAAGKKGCLYLVATPIGNLEDITVRALRTLGEVDLIACEDTRHTSKLLHHYNIHKETVSYHEHNENVRAPQLVERLERGERIALVSDAGMPVISDPGYRLVTLCLASQIPVVPIPGPSALVAALAVCGLPNQEFLFAGFLPSKPAARRRSLERLSKETRTIIFYEAPHRLVAMLAEALDRLGRRQAVIGREITKVHEEFLRGDLAELLVRVQQAPVRGEITVLIGPPEEGQAAAPLSPARLPERVEQVMRERNLDRKAALKFVARERGLSKREAYKQLVDAG